MIIIDAKTSKLKETTLDVDGSEIGFGKNFNVVNVSVIPIGKSPVVVLVVRGKKKEHEVMFYLYVKLVGHNIH